MLKSRTALLILLSLVSMPVLAEEISVGGRILDDRGKPLAKATVELIRVQTLFESSLLALQGKISPGPTVTAVTGADGVFQLKAPEPGMWRVRARARGFVPVNSWLTPLIEPAELPSVRLQRDAPVRVTVLDPEGRPVAGAQMSTEEDPSASRRIRSPLFWMDVWSVEPTYATTGENGTAEVARREGESLRIEVSAPGFLNAKDQKAGKPAGIEVRLARGCDRTLEVFDAQRRPQPETLVVSGLEPLGMTDAAGRLTATFSCDPEVRLGFETRDGRRLEAALRRPAAGETAPPRFVLPRSPIVLSGQVLQKGSRTPVAGALVWTSADFGSFVRTDTKGRYQATLRSSREDRRALSGAAPGYETAMESLSQSQPDGPAGTGPTILLQPAVELAGTIVDESGRPVSEAEIRASPVMTPGPRFSPRSRHSQTRSIAQGRFRLTIAADQAFTLTVSHEDFVQHRQPIAELKQSRKDLKIVLQQGRSASGRITDERDQPIAGAKVALRAVESGQDDFRRLFSELPRPEHAGTSDAQGLFRLDHLPAGTFDLRASAAGFASVTVRGVPIPEGKATAQLGTVILPPGVTIEGMVVDPQDRPLAEASVSAHPGGRFSARFIRAEDEPRQETTGEDGRFVIRDLGAGERLEISVSKEGFADRSLSGVEAPAARPVRIVLSPASTVSGRVVDEKGDPVAEARLLFFRPMEGGMPGMPGVLVGSYSSDPDGRFKAPGVESGKLAIQASARGFLPADLSGLEVPAGKDLDKIEIVLRPGAAVVGRVFGPDGAPVADAAISTVEGEDASFFSRSQATSDGDGNYRLESVAAGPRSISAQHPDYQRAVRDLDVRLGENRLDLRLERGSEVEGRVVDAAGQAVAGADLSLRSTSGRPQESTSGADGSFRFASVDAGTYEVQAEKEGYATTRLRDIRVAGPVRGLELRLDSGGLIRGRISGLDFAEMSRVEISGWSAEGMGRQRGRVDYQGEYRLENVPAGDWNVMARVSSSGRSAQGKVTLEPGAAQAVLDLEFGGGLTLSGRVLRGGEPLSGANVMARGRDKMKSGNATANQEGAFRIEGLEAGTYVVSVMEFRRGINHQKTVELSADRDVLIELPESQISGRVVDAADSAALEGAAVSLENAADEPERPFFGTSTTTDSQGLFTLSGLGEGSYRVLARKDGYAPAETTVQIGNEGGADNLRLALSATEGLTLQVVGPAGAPPEQVSFAFVDAGGQSILTGREPTGEAGRVRISSAPPGHWRLLLAANGTATTAIEVDVPGARQQVVLLPTAPLKVTVPDLAGSSLLATLTVQGSDGRPYMSVSWGALVRAWRLADGQTVIDELPPGTWRLTVTAPDGRTWQGTATTVLGSRSEAVVR